ncbi:hypothetical protein PCANC_05253, partial [Puccinia coronata f. sp. avenae]
VNQAFRANAGVRVAPVNWVDVPMRTKVRFAYLRLGMFQCAPKCDLRIYDWRRLSTPCVQPMAMGRSGLQSIIKFSFFLDALWNISDAGPS